MYLKKESPENTKEIITNCIREQTEDCLYLLYEDTYVVPGNGIQPNLEYISENDVKLFEMPNEGGTIVVSKGDIGFGSVFYENKTNEFLDYCAEKLKEYLISKNLDVKVENNDILVDNTFKVGSFSSRRYGNVIFGVFQISINVNLELIKHVCNKEMVKVPRGLSEYGITTEEIKNWLLKTVSKL